MAAKKNGKLISERLKAEHLAETKELRRILANERAKYAVLNRERAQLVDLKADHAALSRESQERARALEKIRSESARTGFELGRRDAIRSIARLCRPSDPEDGPAFRHDEAVIVVLRLAASVIRTMPVPPDEELDALRIPF